jgi:hypothetical protein
MVEGMGNEQASPQTRGIGGSIQKTKAAAADNTAPAEHNRRDRLQKLARRNQTMKREHAAESPAAAAAAAAARTDRQQSSLIDESPDESDCEQKSR